jgi:GntR family transcriptional repressor for pyruvate dehydrogenase complex
MDALKPVSRTTLSEQIAVQIANMIAAGKWKPGDKLPSEAELCRIFQVGRSSLREALKSLAYVGRVFMRPGEGTYIASENLRFAERMFTPGSVQNEKDFADLFEARSILETEAAALCAQRASEQDLAQIEQIVTEMQRRLESGDGDISQFDVAFHEAIASHSKNRILAQLLQSTQSLTLEAMVKSQSIPGDRQITCTQHAEILRALRLRDVKRARSAMRNHLRVFMRGYRIYVGLSASGGRPANADGVTA